MQFTINRAAFLKRFADVQRAIPGKTTLPILTGIKLDLSELGLRLTGSDADISIETIIRQNDESANLTIIEPGQLVLPARFLGEIIKRLPGDEVKLATTDNFQVEITSGNSAFTINGFDADDYPHLPEINADQEIQLAPDVLKGIITQTVFAVSQQETRPILTGVHFTFQNGQLQAVATDSHRLARRQLALSTDKTDDFVLPGRSLVELSRMLDAQSEATVALRIMDNQIQVVLADTLFYSRLLEGNYPETDQLIPTEASTKVEFETTSLLAAIERASLLSHESRNNVVRLVLTAAAKQATLHSDSPDVGNVEEHLQVISLSGQDLDISFNPDYMKDALRALGPATITLAFTNHLRPFTLAPSEDATHFIQLITPVRTF